MPQLWFYDTLQVRPKIVMQKIVLFVAVVATLPSLLAQAPPTSPKKGENHDLGFKDTPQLPGLPYLVHDSDRPHPKVVTAPSVPGGAPSDAIVLFDGHDLSHWQASASSITKKGGSGAPEWKLES